MLRLATAAVLVILLGYGLIEARPLLAGPVIALSSPASGTESPGLVTVAGTAEHVTALTLDGVPLLTDQDGAFSKVIELPRGGAILSLTATDRFGRRVTKRETVYVPD